MCSKQKKNLENIQLTEKYKRVSLLMQQLITNISLNTSYRLQTGKLEVDQVLQIEFFYSTNTNKIREKHLRIRFHGLFMR